MPHDAAALDMGAADSIADELAELRQLGNQNAFSHALLNPEAQTPQNIVDPQGKVAPKRFAVYRNNVTVSLTEALVAAFPAIVTLLGEDFFKQVARAFVVQNPPTSPVLSQYGEGFGQFIGKIEALSKYAYLPDVARAERAWLRAYHAQDDEPLSADQFAAISQEDLGLAQFEPCAATGLITSPYPLFEIWSASRTGKSPERADLASSVLITRPAFEVISTPLNPAQAELFRLLLSGGTLGEAVEAAIGVDEAFDLATSLGLLISTHAFKSVKIGEGH